MLETRNLQIGYGSKKGYTALNGPADLYFAEGGLTCLLGANGAGKSTLLKTLSNNLAPVKGEVFLNGKDIRSYSIKKLARHLSVVLASPISIENMSLASMVAMGRYPYTGWWGNLGPQDFGIVKDVMHKTGVWHLKDKLITEVSDGERQKAMIARALAQDTPIMLLDEPTAHLDLPAKVEIMHLLHLLARGSGKIIIVSTHDLDLAIQVADYFTLIGKDGRIVQGIPEGLILEGEFEKAFSHSSVQFDKERGNFRIPPVFYNKVSLKGEGAFFLWTKHALERNGFEIVEQNVGLMHINIINSGQDYYWELKGEMSLNKFSKLNDLIQYIKSNNR